MCAVTGYALTGMISWLLQVLSSIFRLAFASTNNPSSLLPAKNPTTEISVLTRRALPHQIRQVPDVLRHIRQKSTIRVIPPLRLFLVLAILTLPGGTDWISPPLFADAHTAMSVPKTGMLVRAVIPVFGVAFSSNPSDPLRIWYLEYGPGRNPAEWTRLKESSTPVREDPYSAGKIKWNPDWGANGNLANWNVGLQGYRYARWRNNLNGIYTLRLVAETRSGRRSETRASVLVGEAIIRVTGGTAISADGGCRVAVPSFAFGERDARVVAIIRQVPSVAADDAGPTDETGGPADEIHATLGRNFELLSPVYRIHPNGLATDPALTLQVDATTPVSHGNPGSLAGASIFEWNPVVQRWCPLPTTWAGNTALARTHHLSDYASFIAILRRKATENSETDFSGISWQAISPLRGYWTGFTEPMAVVKLQGSNRATARTNADANGAFSIPFMLSPGANTCSFEMLSPDGSRTLGRTTRQQVSGPVVNPRTPRLMAPLATEISESSTVWIVCEDSSLASQETTTRRSLWGQARDSGFTKHFPLEFTESIPGSGRFITSISPADPSLPGYEILQTFRQGETLTVSAGSSDLHLTFTDHTPPSVRLGSPTHPCHFYAPGDSPHPDALRTAINHSAASLRQADGCWEIGGVPGPPSARIVRWGCDTINIGQWPLVGFTYKAIDARNWQLLLREENTIRTLNLGQAVSWFADFARTTPLENRNEWIRWQQNLAIGSRQKIDEVSFGSWVKGAFMEAVPAFRDPQAETLWVKDLWIGRTWNSPDVRMEWKIKDASPLRSIEWWVNRSPDSSAPASGDRQGRLDRNPKTTGSCRFTLAESGTWYFHLRATDIADNTSPVTAFPLPVVLPSSVALSGLANDGIDARQFLWEQPSGAVIIPLGDAARLLASKGLRLTIDERDYPMSAAIIDHDAATLRFSAESFDDTTPLGVDGEILNATISGADLDGRPLDNIAHIRLLIKSPFREEPVDGGVSSGMRLRVMHDAIQPVNPAFASAYPAAKPDASRVHPSRTPWLAWWREPHAPWMEFFDGCVNNSVILSQDITDSKARSLPVRWERPVLIVPAPGLRLLVVEALDSPAIRTASSSEAQNLPSIPETGGQLVSSATNSPWIQVTTPESPFRAGYVRLIVATKGEGTRVLRTTLDDALRILRRQTVKQTMRLDGWFAPRQHDLAVSSGITAGNGPVWFSIGSAPAFVPLPPGATHLEGTDEWQRFSLLFRAPSRPVNARQVRIHGTLYW
jgi:hypothetical protein